MKKQKFIFITIEERNGERQYSHNLVREIPKSANPLKWADKNVAAPWFGKDTDAQDDAYYSASGEFCVTVQDAREITKEEFDVLNRFL